MEKKLSTALLDLLNSAKIPYMVVGSFSSNAYGEPRATKDADFVVKMDEKARRSMLSMLPSEFEADVQARFETITGHTRQILRIPSIPFEIELFDLGITSATFSPDGKTLTSGIHDKRIKLWEVASGRPAASIDAHVDCVLSPAYSPDGKILASGSQDGSIELWDLVADSKP